MCCGADGERNAIHDARFDQQCVGYFARTVSVPKVQVQRPTHARERAELVIVEAVVHASKRGERGRQRAQQMEWNREKIENCAVGAHEIEVDV